MTLPLEGIRILDLSRYLPGPLATQMLADFGAEVIKVEDRKGELGRYLPPMLDGTGAPFYSVNRNKKSLTLDLKSEQGREIFRRLAQNSDVIVDQFRPGVMDKLGLGYESLKDINPALIYCSLTGYGLNGPMRDAAGHDLNYLSIAGVTGLNGSADSGPAMSGVQIADVAGGSLYSVIAILMALEARHKTGKGQLCDVAMMDGALSLLSYTIGSWAGSGIVPQRGNELLSGGFATYNIYKCKDGGYVSLGAVEHKFWAEFCKKIGKEEYISLQIDREKQVQIKEDIQEIMLQKSRDEWVDFFADSDICFTPVLDLDEVSNHPQVLARNMMQRLVDFKDSGKDMLLIGVPFHLSENPARLNPSFPESGEHNEEILMQAGYSKIEIEDFMNKGVL